MRTKLFNWMVVAALVFSAVFGVVYLFGGDSSGFDTSATPVFYVDPSRIEGGAGLSWETAFIDLGVALAAAPAGAEIRCAAGDYGSVRVGKAVSIYGGFSGIERSVEERDWTINRSVLEGVISAAPTVIDGFVLRLDTASEGAAFFNGTAAGIVNCRVEGSTTGLELLYFDSVARVQLINTYICANHAGISTSSSLVAFAGCDDVLILNSTIANNQLEDPTQAMLKFFNSRGAVINTILWNPENREIYSNWLSEIEISHSLVRGWRTGRENLDDDPRLDSEYRLKADSPCRNAALTKVAPERDWKGTVRPFGEAADIGADECVLPFPAEEETKREDLKAEEFPLFFPRLLGEPTPTPSPSPSPTPTATPSPTPWSDCDPVEGFLEGFDEFVAESWTVPSGWEFYDINPGDIYTSAGNYGVSLPSLKFSTTGAEAVSREFSDAETLFFWIRGLNTDSFSSLRVEEYFADDWNSLTEIIPIPLSGLRIGPLALDASAVRLRFTYEKSVGNLALDDVSVCLPAPPTPVPSPTSTPAPSPSPSATPSPSPSPLATPTTTPTVVSTPSAIPWDGGLLLNPGFEFWDTEGQEADHWTWDSPAAQWCQTTDAYYGSYAGRFSREASTEGNLDQFGKTMTQDVVYYAGLMAKGSGEIRIGIRYPHTVYSNYGAWTALSDSDWTLLRHQAAPSGSGSNGGLRIQVRECFGNYLMIDNAYLDDVSVFPTPTPCLPSAPLEVVINEIGWMGTAVSANHEYIELYNTTEEAIALNGWTIRATDETPDITLSGTIPALGYFLLERTSDDTITGIEADQIYTGALENTGELLELRDGTGQLIDEANHEDDGWFAGAAEPGYYSMERIDSALGGTEASNWRSNDGCLINGFDADENPLNATPKSLNSAFYPSRPAMLNLNAGDGEVELGWLASVRGRFELAGYNVYRRQIGQSYQEPLNEEPIVTSYYTDDTVTNGVRYYYEVRSVDSEGNESVCSSNEETVIPGPPPPLGDNVIISEVMFSPVGDDNLYEWIELYNPTNAAIGLDLWWITNADQRGKFTFPDEGNLSIEPGQFLILGASQYANGGDVDAVYNNQSTTEGNIQLRDTGDDVYLYNELNELVDHVSYSSNWIREAGRSIVRKAVTRSSNFVELQNTGDRSVNLVGLKICDGSETDSLQAYATSATVLEPGGFALIINNLFYNRYDIPSETVVVTCGDLAIGSGLMPFKDLILYERDGETMVDTFTSFSDVQQPSVNTSVEKIDLLAGDNENNWDYCVDSSGSTPGLINSLTEE